MVYGHQACPGLFRLAAWLVDFLKQDDKPKPNKPSWQAFDKPSRIVACWNSI
jgi:hypothetical protein